MIPLNYSGKLHSCNKLTFGILRPACTSTRREEPITTQPITNHYLTHPPIMAIEFIGRKLEKEVLKEAIESSEAEMVAVIGRRRIGKTFLVV